MVSSMRDHACVQASFSLQSKQSSSFRNRERSALGAKIVNCTELTFHEIVSGDGLCAVNPYRCWSAKPIAQRHRQKRLPCRRATCVFLLIPNINALRGPRRIRVLGAERGPEGPLDVGRRYFGGAKPALASQRRPIWGSPALSLERRTPGGAHAAAAILSRVTKRRML